MATGEQFGRIANLIVADTSIGQGRDLSALQFSFEVRQADNETPNTLVVRIYNLSPDTENEVTSLYKKVALQVGYEGTGVDTLFTGTIKQFRRGKASNVDTFLEISAADGDLGYNFGLLNTTLGGGATHADVLRKAAAAMGTPTDTTNLSSFGGILPRGKVLFGLARVHLRELAATIGARWSIQDGELKFISDTGYLADEVVVLNSQTGMVGIPESTNGGISVRCLMNPLMKVGGRVQIASDDIVQSTANADDQKTPGNGINFPSYGSQIYPATVQRGLGIYRIIVAEHAGDTRETEWYTDLVCLNIDPTASAGDSVAPTG